MSDATERAAVVVSQLTRLIELRAEAKRVYAELVVYKSGYVNDEAAWWATLDAMTVLSPQPSASFRLLNKRTDAEASSIANLAEAGLPLATG